MTKVFRPTGQWVSKKKDRGLAVLVACRSLPSGLLFSDVLFEHPSRLGRDHVLQEEVLQLFLVGLCQLLIVIDLAKAEAQKRRSMSKNPMSVL